MICTDHTVTGRTVASYLAKLPFLSPSKCLIRLLDALIDLAGEKDTQVLSSLKLRPTGRPEDQKKIDAICQYLNENFEEDVDFVGLSDRFNMTQPSLCRFFKRATGRTLTTYLNELRVGAAAQLLMHSDESILDISFRVGFGNYSNFNRQFKRIKGVGPRTLRRHFLAEQFRNGGAKRHAQSTLHRPSC